MKKNSFQKITLFIACFSSTFVFSQTLPAQANTQWKINGNIADSTHFIGTKNEAPLKFRSFDIERMRVTSDGMVGIGTKTPKELLDVNGNAILRGKLILPGLILDNLTTGRDIIFSDGNGNLTRGGVAGLAVELYQPGAACRTDQNGDNPNPSWANGLNKIYSECPRVNIGMGTNNPRVKLDVMGSIYSNKISLGIADPLTLGTNYFYLKSAYSVTNNTSIFLIENGTRKLFQINNDGLVRAREIMVDLDNWPDYVFKPNYKLLSLNEIENFILKNKHLPNIPSAENIEKNGLNLGEMNKLLIEKIEELTLHLINQEKTNQIQNDKISLLNLEIEKLKEK